MGDIATELPQPSEGESSFVPPVPELSREELARQLADQMQQGYRDGAREPQSDPFGRVEWKPLSQEKIDKLAQFGMAFRKLAEDPASQIGEKDIHLMLAKGIIDGVMGSGLVEIASEAGDGAPGPRNRNRLSELLHSPTMREVGGVRGVISCLDRGSARSHAYNWELTGHNPYKSMDPENTVALLPNDRVLRYWSGAIGGRGGFGVFAGSRLSVSDAEPQFLERVDRATPGSTTPPAAAAA